MHDHEVQQAVLAAIREQNGLLAEIRDRLPERSGGGTAQPVPDTPTGPQPVKLVEPKPPADVSWTTVAQDEQEKPKRRGRPPGSGRRQPTN